MVIQHAAQYLLRAYIQHSLKHQAADLYSKIWQRSGKLKEQSGDLCVVKMDSVWKPYGYAANSSKECDIQAWRQGLQMVRKFLSYFTDFVSDFSPFLPLLPSCHHHTNFLLIIKLWALTKIPRTDATYYNGKHINRCVHNSQQLPQKIILAKIPTAKGMAWLWHLTTLSQI